MTTGKAPSVCGRLVNIWKSKSISLLVKIKLCIGLSVACHFNTTVYVAQLIAT